MQTTKYTMYWMLDGYPYCEQTTDLVVALKRMEQMRNTPGYGAIALSTENADWVGPAGAEFVSNGKTPDGVDYTWVKRRDGGQ